ncbi:hypothetical protein POM88_052085 [Heracleum sosnowskyi]|uniref:Uncharacterized protein n=1 Tax=Heracleum sosnowskyi TaxID=360622 RepID=A0AAD8GRB8_9APIA|nr:hypothetical protein POM88_052085 [Heracleum sosnowskyi]
MYYSSTQGVDQQLCCNNSSPGDLNSIETEGYCTLESSMASASFGSASISSFSNRKSSISKKKCQSYLPDSYQSPDNNNGSPVSVSCLTDDTTDLRQKPRINAYKHKLKELKTVMLGPDSEFFNSFNCNLASLEINNWKQIFEEIPRRDMPQVLIACAKAVLDNDSMIAQWLMAELRLMVSVSGEPVPRLGAYLLEGLVARVASSGSLIYKSLRCKEPECYELLSHLNILYEVPFQFHAAVISGTEIQLESLGIHAGEALAVNFAFMLHQTPDESVSTQNHRDGLLRFVKRLSPRVVTLVEQESNTNIAAFFPRFLETLDYYTAMFESIDTTLPREHKDMINVEQHCLARDVVNIKACEGTERVERHELLGKWKSRFKMVGFSPYPWSSLVNGTIKFLLNKYCDKYKLEEREEALYLGWMNRDLVATCAWK